LRRLENHPLLAGFAEQERKIISDATSKEAVAEYMHSPCRVLNLVVKIGVLESKGDRN